MKALASLVALIVLVFLLDAATLPGASQSVTHAFPYPVQGLEHVVALFAMGIVASGYAGRGIWILPLFCVLTFAAGLSTGMLNPATLAQPTAIAVVFSAFVSVAMVISGRAPKLALAVPAFALLAFIHGYAHGIGISSDVSAVRYSRELVSAVAIILLSGLLVGTAFRLLRRGWTTQKADGSQDRSL